MIGDAEILQDSMRYKTNLHLKLSNRKAVGRVAEKVLKFM